MKQIGEQQERSMLPPPRRLISYGSKPGGAFMVLWGSPYRCTAVNYLLQSISGSVFSEKKPKSPGRSSFNRFANLSPSPKFTEVGENFLVIHPKRPAPQRCRAEVFISRPSLSVLLHIKLRTDTISLRSFMASQF